MLRQLASELARLRWHDSRITSGCPASPRMTHDLATPALTAAARLAVLVLLVAVAPACGHRPPAPMKGRVLIADITISGNENIDDDDLLDGLALTRLADSHQDYDAYLVGIDGKRIRGVYLRQGYFQVQVDSRVQEKGGLARIHYTVKEGPRAHLARVVFERLPADPHIDREMLRDLIELDDGDPFVYEAFDQAKPKVVAALEAAGYAHAKVEPALAADRVRNEAILTFEVDAGPVCRFGAIELAGVEGALADAARARLMVHQGERYSAALLADSQDALYDLGRFATVRIEPDRSAGAPVVPVKISVVEAPPHELRLGGGFGVNPVAYEVRGRASYRIAGWPTELTTTYFELRPAYVIQKDDDDAEPRLEAVMMLERKDLFRTFLKGEVETSFEYRAVEAYTAYGPRLRLGLRTPIYRRIVEIAAGWQYRALRFSRIDVAAEPAREQLGLEDPYLLGFYEQSLLVDLRDDPIQPRLGAYAEVQLQEGTRYAGGELDYFRVAPELRGYVPLGPVVLAGRARVGTFRGDIPVTERYFAGGASSQRGFPERRLAPTLSRTVEVGDPVREVTFSAPVGGGALIESGLELRFPITEVKGLPLGGVSFLDGADVTERFRQLDAVHQHWATGAGVRLGTPIGPVRFDVGYRLNRTGAGELRRGDRFAFHLSLGEAF
jgi:outer membrane protein assembly factor BamA